MRSPNLVEIPEELARAHGLREGVEVRWETGPDGKLVLCGASPSDSLSKPRRDLSELRGSLKAMLAPEGGGVEAFLEWRREDARLDGSL